jgi:hypothetical protein
VDKGEQVIFFVTVEFEDYPYELTTETHELEVYGYKSSEKVLTTEDLDHNGYIVYEAVARVDAVLSNDEFITAERWETLRLLDFVQRQRQRTGYGIDIEFSLEFTSEIGPWPGVDGEPDLAIDLIVPTSLVDTRINEEFKEDFINDTYQYVMPLSFAGGTRQLAPITTINLTFTHPEVWVQPGSGELFTTNQKEETNKVDCANLNVDDRANQPCLHNGGNRFYIPIWHDLGDYILNYKSEIGIGRNLMTIDLEQDLEIFAFMYASLDEAATQQDKILLHPIFSDMQIPDGWEEEEKIQWLQPERHAVE